MSEAETPPVAEKNAGWLIRAFLIALPIGLGFMVPLSLWIYYQKKHQPAAATSQYAAMLRKDLDAEDFVRYARILSQDIGERSLAKPENLDAASSFIESTMGYDNMGYAVQRQTFDMSGKTAANLVAELTGVTKPNEMVLVVANYDEADAAGVAALMSVAHALAGARHARTVRFAAVMASAGGMAHLRKSMSAEGKVLRTLILASSAPDRAVDKIPPGEDEHEFEITNSKDAGAILSQLHALKDDIEKSADAR